MVLAPRNDNIRWPDNIAKRHDNRRPWAQPTVGAATWMDATDGRLPAFGPELADLDRAVVFDFLGA